MSRPRLEMRVRTVITQYRENFSYSTSSPVWLWFCPTVKTLDSGKSYLHCLQLHRHQHFRQFAWRKLTGWLRRNKEERRRQNKGIEERFWVYSFIRLLVSKLWDTTILNMRLDNWEYPKNVLKFTLNNLLMFIIYNIITI